MFRRFRHVFTKLTPWWLHRGEGRLLLFSAGLMLDAQLERTRQGVTARFPTRAPRSVLQILGRDRGLLQGKAEPDEVFAERLRTWRYPRGHKVRGNDYALLDQVSTYFRGIDTAVLDASGHRYTRTANGVLGSERDTGWNWDGNGAPNWSRSWIEVESPEGVTAWPDFGPTLWSGDTTLGMRGVSATDFTSMRILTQGLRPFYPAWVPAGHRCEWMIIRLDGSAISAHPPDGTWKHWGRTVGGVKVPARYRGWRYIALREELTRYAGRSSEAPDTVPLVGGGQYTGVAANAGSTIPLPDGTTYTPDPDNAPTTVPLLDDGD